LSAFSPDTVAKASWQLLSDFNNLFTSISESGNRHLVRNGQNCDNSSQSTMLLIYLTLTETITHNPKMKCLHKRLNQKEQDKRIPEGKFLDLSNCPDLYFIKE